MVKKTPQDEPPAELVAAIDIGSNAVEMTLAQVGADGAVELLSEYQRAARLGQDTFRSGKLGQQAIRAVVNILRDYDRVLEDYSVQDRFVRAVATSAVREARNADTFLDRVAMATGLPVEVIDTSEESRLMVSAVRHRLGTAHKFEEGITAIVDVGGGSTLVTLLESGELLTSQSLRLGSIRLQEMLTTSHDTPQRAAELLSQHISTSLATTRKALPLSKVQVFVAVGADAAVAAGQVGTARDDGLWTIQKRRFDQFVTRCRKMTPEALAGEYRLAAPDAETLDPALLVYEALLAASRAKRMTVVDVSMRDGLVLDLAAKVTGKEFEPLAEGVIHSAIAVAERYQSDMDHAHAVAELCDHLFDELSDEHRLSGRHRILLLAAALLHEVGGFVSNSAHHKHTFYLVSNSEIYGLTRDELNIVAQVARYHRRSVPKASHVEYTALPRPTRVIVCKLAAILRVADALDRGHGQQVREITCRRDDNQFIITVEGLADATLERRALAAKGDLFEDIYGMSVRLDQA